MASSICLVPRGTVRPICRLEGALERREFQAGNGLTNTDGADLAAGFEPMLDDDFAGRERPARCAETP
jgi:hypothetical protein